MALAVALLPACSGDPARIPARTDLDTERQIPVPDLPEPTPGAGFIDVTLAAGIRAAHRPATDDLTNIVDAVGAGAAFADFDGDGWLDLVVANGPRSPEPGTAGEQRILIYRNLANGRFEDATERSGIPNSAGAVAIAVGDVDGDGDRDLYLADRGPNRLFLNRGDGTFEESAATGTVADPGFSVGATFLDLEGDGDLDLYVTNYLEFDPSEDNYFAPDGYPGPLSYKAQPDSLYRNRGDGTFEDISSSSGVDTVLGRGMSLAAADFDGDGDTDVFVANDATANFLLLNDREGTFTESALLAGVAMGENGEQTSAMAADVGDLDGDGLLDLTVSDTAFGAVYRQTRPGQFRDEVMRSGVGMLSGQYVSWGQNLIDYDNDGRLDLFIANGGLHHFIGWEDLLLRNVGGFRFQDAAEGGGPYFGTRHVGRSSIVADYDNDGDMDVFVTNLDGRHILLRNDVADQSGWITLDLVGRQARDPLGARVRVEVEGRTLLAECRSRSAYLGQGDPRLHFGLGSSRGPIERIHVEWPGGAVTEMTDVDPDRILRISETL